MGGPVDPFSIKRIAIEISTDGKHYMPVKVVDFGMAAPVIAGLEMLADIEQVILDYLNTSIRGDGGDLRSAQNDH